MSRLTRCDLVTLTLTLLTLIKIPQVAAAVKRMQHLIYLNFLQSYSFHLQVPAG